jgi:hypothetical protein
MLSQYDCILVQPFVASLIKNNFPDLFTKVRLFPVLNFSAYHPDLVYIRVDSAKDFLHGPLGHYNSAIAFWGFLHGLSIANAIALFNEGTYEALGYFDFWQTSRQALIDEGAITNFPLGRYLDSWSRVGCFMHSVNHPRLFVFADVAKELLTRLGLPIITGATNYLSDEFADGPVWPVFPEIAARLGIEGRYYFKIGRGLCPIDRPVAMLDLREFVESSFEAFGKHGKGDLICDRMDFECFRTLDAVLATKAATRLSNGGESKISAATSGISRRTPYTDLPAHQFWRSAVATVPLEDVDPVVSSRLRLSKDTKIATAGSCFAQHISRTLQRNGFNYYIAETGYDLPANEARNRNYGVFSARFGNLYTARQLVQLFERAFGTFVPSDTEWRRADGRYVDPFRPQVEPDGFDSPEAVAASRHLHFDTVREMFQKLDVLIFTLGLTEAWRSKVDGAVFPLAPGVAGGSMDFSRYEFVNFRVADVVADLDRFLDLLQNVNPHARLVITVSPVPLIATYEREHVLVANTYSKAVLRAAATEVCQRHENCAYFPSYEIVCGNYARGVYYGPDLRAVTSAGIDHVMRLFLKHYYNGQNVDNFDPVLLKELRTVNEIICDEEAIDLPQLP